MPQLIGPIILDLMGTEISQEERELLQHPLVGGVILFTRNYITPKELKELCRSIRQSRDEPLLITVDHEGGRVQRFRGDFTSIPSMGQIGKLYEQSPETALQLAEICGWLLASELLAFEIDLSFAPVLDLNKEANPAIGDRSFHRDPQHVTKLAKRVMKGMHAAGMAATGKHFPGHGSVTLDSHVTLPMDSRSFSDIQADDLQPFLELIHAGIDAIMPSHIVFPTQDDKPVSCSKHWLQTVLRKQCQFNGFVFSDDLNMQALSVIGDYTERANRALEAGCDMILICNNRNGAIQILDRLPQTYFLDEQKVKPLRGKWSDSFNDLRSSSHWRKQQAQLMQLTESLI